MDQVRDFLNALRNDPKARELARDMKQPETAAETAECYVQLAQAMGYHLTGKDMLEGLKALEQEQQERTAKANSKVEKIALDDDDLDAVTGGYNASPAACAKTYKEGEWCWMTDSCARLVADYPNYGSSYEGIWEDGGIFAPLTVRRGSEEKIWEAMYGNSARRR